MNCPSLEMRYGDWKPILRVHGDVGVVPKCLAKVPHISTGLCQRFAYVQGFDFGDYI